MVRYQSITLSEQDKNATEEKIAESGERQTAKRIHWLTPVVMVGSMLLGLVFAIAHDRFYNSYDGQAVGSGREQKLIVDVGTAFAFLVKMFFRIAAASVLSQQLFQSLRHKAESISNIDALFNISGNALHFVKVALWIRHPALAAIAIVIWCMPTASVFTPGTITVQPQLKNDSGVLLRAAQPQQSWIGTQNFAQTQIDYTAIWSVQGLPGTFADATLWAPSGTLYSVALGSASQRNVLQIPAPRQNSSYELSFLAPALSCSSLSAQDLSNFEGSLKKARADLYLGGEHTILEILEGQEDPSGLVVKYNSWQGDLSTPDWNNGSNVQASWSAAGHSDAQYFYFNTSDQNVLLVCYLHNATYLVDFSFQNSIQTVDLKALTIHEPVPFNATVNVDNTNYGNIVYNAIYYAFHNIVTAIAVNDTDNESPDLLTYGTGPVLVSALRDYIEDTIPLNASAAIATIESIFHNITISTLSAPPLRLPDAEARPISGKTWRTVNIYVYSPTDLRVAYGAALAATLLCVLWGLFLMLRNHAAYSVDFSTIVRTTRREEIGRVVDASDRMGREPLPKQIGRVKLRYAVDDGFVAVVGDKSEDVAGHGRSDGDGVAPHSALTATGVGNGLKVRRKPVPVSETRM